MNINKEQRHDTFLRMDIFWSRKAKPDSETFIYELVDPRDKTIKYVGKTSKPIEAYHYHYYSRGEFPPALTAWQDELREQGMTLAMAVIEGCDWIDEDTRLKSCINSRDKKNPGALLNGVARKAPVKEDNHYEQWN